MNKVVMIFAGLLVFTLFNCQSKQQDGKEKTKVTNELNQSKNPVIQKNSGTDAPVHITKADFINKVMDYEKNPKTWVYKGELPCLVDFYADWCAPCRLTGPIMEDLAKEYSGRIVIYKVNVDQERELASVFGVQSIPAFLFCPVKGNPSISSGIAGSPEETKAMFKQQIEKILLQK